MEEYFTGIFAATAVITICSLLAYKGGRATRFALAVLLIYAVLTPLSALISDFGGLLSGDDISGIEGYSKDYEVVAKDAFCEGIDKLVCSELGLDTGCVRVECRGFNYKEMKSDKVLVILSGKAIVADSLKIRRVVEDNGLGECEVKIEIG